MYIENLHYNFYIDEMSKRKNELSNVQTRINKLNSIIKGTVRCSYRAKAVGK